MKRKREEWHESYCISKEAWDDMHRPFALIRDIAELVYEKIKNKTNKTKVRET